MIDLIKIITHPDGLINGESFIRSGKHELICKYCGKVFYRDKKVGYCTTRCNQNQINKLHKEFVRKVRQEYNCSFAEAETIIVKNRLKHSLKTKRSGKNENTYHNARL